MALSVSKHAHHILQHFPKAYRPIAFQRLRVGRPYSCFHDKVIIHKSANFQCRRGLCTSHIVQEKWQWEQPVGFETGVVIHNTLTNSKVPLILRHDHLATWYMCGPTVYDGAHIGHASSYIKFDIIRRILENFFNIDVVMVMGVTDIDDKIINRSRELGVCIEFITKQYEQEFFQDLGKLRVLPPSTITRVRDHIPCIIDFCDKIIKSGFAYATKEGSVYFDSQKFGYKGKLSPSQATQEVDEETGDSEKKCPRDFALWKGAKPGEPWWDAPWGKGRPGWHIECSAMASRLFGNQVDIHTGGKDLIFPHHENEEAQSEAYHNTKQWVNYWLHTGHLHLAQDIKMSKSLQNTISVQEFLREHSVNEFRIFCLKSPYRNDVEYSEFVLNDARVINQKLEDFLADAEAYVDGHLTCKAVDEVHLLKCLSDAKETVLKHLSNDFNTPKALKAIMDLTSECNKFLQSTPNSIQESRSPAVIAACSSYIKKTASIFGMEYQSRKELILSSNPNQGVFHHVMDSLVKFRNKVRVYALTVGPSARPQYKMHTPDEIHDADSTVAASSSSSSSDPSLPQLPEEPPQDKGDMQWTTKSDAKRIQQLKRKEREPLISACDELRQDLFVTGVILKDRGRESNWSLMEDTSLQAKKSSYATHDTFDPDYVPKK